MIFIRTLFFIPAAIIANSIAYPLVQVIFSFNTFLEEFDLNSVMEYPSIFEDVVGQVVGVYAFFVVGLYVAPSFAKKYRIALIIFFSLLLILNSIAIITMNQNYRFFGVITSLIAACSIINDDDFKMEE